MTDYQISTLPKSRRRKLANVATRQGVDIAHLRWLDIEAFRPCMGAVQRFSTYGKGSSLDDTPVVSKKGQRINTYLVHNKQFNAACQVNELTQAYFDYAVLPIDAALTARAAAERIKLRLKRTVEDIIEIGRELTAVKDQLPHGQFLPWVAAEFEMSQWTANQFMNAADRFGDKLEIITNLKPTILYSLAAPSTPESVVTQAIEHVESGEKVTIADVKKWKQRAEESQKESNERRKKIRDLEYQVDLLKAAQPADNERIIEKEVIPPDYEAAKQKAAALEGELKALKADQQKIVDSQVQAKLRGYQSELDELERKKAQLDDMVARKQAYMESLSSDVKRIETHRSVIDGIRLELIGLAAFLSDMEDMRDLDTIRRWQALGCMLQEAKSGIDALFPAKPRLEVINHV